MTDEPRSFVGLDIGTSGGRAVALDAGGHEIATERIALPKPLSPAPGWVEQDPALWWRATLSLLASLATKLADRPPVAICVDATSATLLLARPDGEPLGPALMYNDRRALAAARRIARIAPEDSPAQGPGSSLAKLIHLYETLGAPPGTLVLHQADWILGRLTGRFGFSDWNNVLKLGYDAGSLGWPDWVERLVPPGLGLPKVLAPGAPLGRIAPSVARLIGFPDTTRILAGTTDSTAAVIAAGAARPGDAVTSLGSTLVVKILSERPVTASRYGVYSQRFGDHWLVGGASNSGGAVLRQCFPEAGIAALSRSIDPETSSGFDYYPLPGPGERFPRQDPHLAPRMDPRPADPARFLHGLLEGIATIEAEAYARLAELGAPRPSRVLTVGGGAGNTVWTRIRSRLLGIEVREAEHSEAAFGTARLALAGSSPPMGFR
ncbi:FGGY-family carbohydrate kinase [Thiocystis violacea]|uniref:FGGY-family carbohydrate kinase n=1 Tax=Thiocystis violacea TaxID=13725 RepID=UPI001907EB6C|nr:FGGY-family carbohydrate kinase [Thiocystis violacea]MBK1720103.1 carbohydrate kinase [Thiocystis violacea]